MTAWLRRQRRSGGARPQLHNPPILAKASGTFNPLCRVLCILQSLYLCAIGPMVVALIALHLARDTPCTSNCTPKQLYAWMRPEARTGTAAARWHIVGDSCPLWFVGPFQAPSWRAAAALTVSTAPAATHSVDDDSLHTCTGKCTHGATEPVYSVADGGFPFSCSACGPSPFATSFAITQATAVACSSSTE